MADMGVAQNLRAVLTRVFVFGSIDQGAIMETQWERGGSKLWTKSISELETMVETMFCWYLQGNHHSRVSKNSKKRSPESPMGAGR